MKKGKNYVFDSYAVFTYLEGEPGAEKIADILKNALADRCKIFMSIINVGEVYYIVMREQGKNAAQLYLKTIERYPIIFENAEKEITLEAAEIKAFNKLSYADSFAAALAMRQKAKLVTGDKEFNCLKNKISIE